jgi:hypothetical protein
MSGRRKPLEISHPDPGESVPNGFAAFGHCGRSIRRVVGILTRLDPGQPTVFRVSARTRPLASGNRRYWSLFFSDQKPAGNYSLRVEALVLKAKHDSVASFQVNDGKPPSELTFGRPQITYPTSGQNVCHSFDATGTATSSVSGTICGQTVNSALFSNNNWDLSFLDLQCNGNQTLIVTDAGGLSSNPVTVNVGNWPRCPN